MLSSLNRRRWAAETGLDLYGLKVGMRSNRPEILDQMLPHLPTGWKHSSSTQFDRLYSVWVDGADEQRRDSVTLYRGSRCLVRNTGWEDALANLEFDVELFVVENNPARVFVHAGVVGWQGQAIVTPGCSYSGKSTLVAALCRAGATYYSDEYALFDADGMIYPYPRPLRLRPTGDGVAPTIADLNLSPGDGPLPLGLVVLTSYQPGVILQPRVISPGEALLMLLGNTMSARRRPHMVLPSLQRALTSGRVLAGPRGEAGETAERLLCMAG
jgi:hypothetical protein